MLYFLDISTKHFEEFNPLYNGVSLRCTILTICNFLYSEAMFIRRIYMLCCLYFVCCILQDIGKRRFFFYYTVNTWCCILQDMFNWWISMCMYYSLFFLHFEYRILPDMFNSWISIYYFHYLLCLLYFTGLGMINQKISMYYTFYFVVCYRTGSME